MVSSVAFKEQELRKMLKHYYRLMVMILTVSLLIMMMKRLAQLPRFKHTAI